MLNQYRYHGGQFQKDFSVFKLTGSDVFTFLQAQSTFDIKSIIDGCFHLAAFLDPQGRSECYGWLLKDGSDYLYLVPPQMNEVSSERINRYLISEDVEVEGPQLESWTFLIGPRSQEHKSSNSFSGKLFDEAAILQKEQVSSLPNIPEEIVDDWRALTGWVSFDGMGFSKEIINNQRLFDLAVVTNKGCYPGQETVSKIATRRGAAYAPVLLEVSTPVGPGEITNFGKKIGSIGSTHAWEGKLYSEAVLLRDFRVEGLKVSFTLGESSYTATVRYYPLIKGHDKDKALELFYEASDHFRDDRYEEAEKCLLLAIELDPTLADAYESLGVMLGRFERFQEAVEVMKKLSEVDPSSVLAHTNMSLFLMRMGRIDEAEEQKSMATVKSFQQFGKEAETKEAIENEKKARQAEWEQRESMFLQVLEIDEEDTLANYGIGSIAVEKAEWERAKKHLEKVLEADPKYSVAYLALGKTYLALGNKDLAEATWKKGVSVAASKGDLMPANQMQSELERL
jgi:folate-binding Fe-S cluster repair protein YgfZ/tetratricopeptide (TPR) repeat protein